MKKGVVTYCKQKKRKEFNWFETLNRPTKDFTEKEMNRLEKLSGNWVTCACGNQCAIIPREGGYGSAQPKDYNLSTLGDSFNIAITRMSGGIYYYHKDDSSPSEKEKYLKSAQKHHVKAIEILKKIEERSAILIQKEVEKCIQKLALAGYKVVKK